MAEFKKIYKCELCGDIAEVLHAGAGSLSCCGQPMKPLAENSVDASREKHVPVIEKTGTGFRVKVGGMPHPMEEKHFIEWIELVADGRSLRKFLRPGDAPEAEFCVNAAAVSAREYCNLHGLWKGEL